MKNYCKVRKLVKDMDPREIKNPLDWRKSINWEFNWGNRIYSKKPLETTLEELSLKYTVVTGKMVLDAQKENCAKAVSESENYFNLSQI